jgi:hypothetical protein
MEGSAHRIVCAGCRQNMAVSETPVPNPNGEAALISTGFAKIRPAPTWTGEP